MKICMIGSCGHWGYALYHLGQHELAGVAGGFADEDMGAVITAAGQAGQKPKPFFNWVKMLDEAKPDVAVISTEFHLQAGIASEALRRGIAVFCEKPMATTHEGLAKLREAQKGANAHLAAMLALRYDPAMVAAREAVSRGDIGEVRLVSAQKSYKLGKRGSIFRSRERSGGTILWVGIHGIDWIRWFAGAEFRSVSALHSKLANDGHEELETTAACLFQLENGIAATLTCDYLRPNVAASHGDDRVRAAGSLGVVEVRGGKAILINKDGERELPLQPEVPAFAAFLRQVEGGMPCLISAEDSFAANHAGLLARDAADSGQTRFFA